MIVALIFQLENVDIIHEVIVAKTKKSPFAKATVGTLFASQSET